MRSGLHKELPILLILLPFTPLLGQDATFPLHEAAVKGDINAINDIVAAGTAIDQQNQDKVTPLMLACKEGQVSVISHLLSLGSSLYLTDPNGNTPLHFAAMCANSSAASTLLQWNADTNAINNDGQTPWDLANRLGHADTMFALEANAYNQLQPQDLFAQAEKIIADANSILTALKGNPGVALKLAPIQKSLKLEESAWMSRRQTNHSRLARAVSMQTSKEFALVIDIAGPDANDVNDAVTAISSDWKERYDFVGKKLREQLRQSSAGPGAMARPTRRRPTTTPTTTSEYGEIAPDPEQELQQSMSSWLTSGSDNRTELCAKVKQEYLKDMMSVRDIAKKNDHEAAILVIDALMLTRATTLDNLVIKIEDRRARDAERNAMTSPDGMPMGRRRGRR